MHYLMEERLNEISLWETSQNGSPPFFPFGNRLARWRSAPGGVWQ
jgi:hypothetical protein